MNTVNVKTVKIIRTMRKKETRLLAKLWIKTKIALQKKLSKQNMQKVVIVKNHTVSRSIVNVFKLGLNVRFFVIVIHVRT